MRVSGVNEGIWASKKTTGKSAGMRLRSKRLSSGMTGAMRSPENKPGSNAAIAFAKEDRL
jgi:hypothetical protein